MISNFFKVSTFRIKYENKTYYSIRCIANKWEKIYDKKEKGMVNKWYGF